MEALIPGRSDYIQEKHMLDLHIKDILKIWYSDYTTKKKHKQDTDMCHILWGKKAGIKREGEKENDER